MAFCIPKYISQQLQDVARQGKINMEQLYEMNSQQRRAFFKQYTNDEVAKGINAGFENAIASEKVSAMRTWVKNTFSIKDKVRKQNVLDRIEQLSEMGALTPEAEHNFLQDLVAEKLGITISPEEAQTINKLSTELRTEFERKTDQFGLPGEAYFIKRREIENYLITPASLRAFILKDLRADDLIEAAERAHRLETFETCLEEILHALTITGKPDPWVQTVLRTSWCAATSFQARLSRLGRCNSR